MAEIVRLCSRNEGKLRELRAALPGWTIELLDADEEMDEASLYHAIQTKVAGLNCF